MTTLGLLVPPAPESRRSGIALVVLAFGMVIGSPRGAAADAIVRVPLPEVTSLSADVHLACARTPAGDAYCWQPHRVHIENGESFVPEKMPFSAPVSAVLATGESACAILASGQSEGQVECLTLAVEPDGGIPYLLRADGRWTGGEPFARSTVPTRLTALAGMSGHACGITASADVECWNAQENERWGEAAGLRGRIAGVRGVIRVAVGHAQACAITNDAVTGRGGSVLCWNRHGLPPWKVGGEVTKLKKISDAGEVAVGGEHACVLRKSGQVLCWGHGHLPGFDGSHVVSEPEVLPLPGPAVSIAAHMDRTCATLASGRIICLRVGEAPMQIKTGSIVAPLTYGICALDPAHQVTCQGRLVPTASVATPDSQ
jgi:hypothetical protein